MTKKQNFNKLTISNVSGQVSLGNKNEQTQITTLPYTELLTQLIEEIKDNLPTLEVEEDNHKEIQAKVAVIEAETTSSNPQQTIIKESLDTIRNILEGATGSILATGLLQQIQQIMMYFPK